MIKYAQIINEQTKQCEVGMGTNAEFYRSVGMTEMEVEQAYDGAWYVKGYAPEKLPPILTRTTNRRFTWSTRTGASKWLRFALNAKRNLREAQKLGFARNARKSIMKLLLHCETQDAMSNRLSNVNGAGGFLPEKRTKRSVKHAEKKEDMAARRWRHTAKENLPK